MIRLYGCFSARLSLQLIVIFYFLPAAGKNSNTYGNLVTLKAVEK